MCTLQIQEVNTGNIYYIRDINNHSRHNVEIRGPNAVDLIIGLIADYINFCSVHSTSSWLFVNSEVSAEYVHQLLISTSNEEGGPIFLDYKKDDQQFAYY